MKQFKMNPKPASPAPKRESTTTRQELDTLTREIATRIGKDPKKAAKVFESWLNGKSEARQKKKTA